MLTNLTYSPFFHFFPVKSGQNTLLLGDISMLCHHSVQYLIVPYLSRILIKKACNSAKNWQRYRIFNFTLLWLEVGIQLDLFNLWPLWLFGHTEHDPRHHLHLCSESLNLKWRGRLKNDIEMASLIWGLVIKSCDIWLLNLEELYFR